MAIEDGPALSENHGVQARPTRQTEGFLHSIAALLGLGIEIHRDYSTLCRRSRLLRKKLRSPESRKQSTHAT